MQMRRVLVGFRCAAGQLTASQGLNLPKASEMPMPLSAPRRHNSHADPPDSVQHPTGGDQGRERTGHDYSAIEGSADDPFSWEPSAKQRRNLVWIGFFKSRADIPQFLSFRVFNRYQKRLRFLAFFAIFTSFALFVIVGHFVTERQISKYQRRRDTIPRELRQIMLEDAAARRKG